MPSHFTVVPASTRAGKETIRLLLGSETNPIVRGIYRDPSKAPAEFTNHANFDAVKGDVSPGTGDLDFTNSDAVLYVPPPTYDGMDQGQFATLAALKIQDAIQKAPSVKRLVLHSAMGAENNHSIGVLRLNHIADDMLKSAASEVVIIKPGYFFETFADAVKSVKAGEPEFVSPFSPAEWKIPMVSAKDVGELCATTLLDKSAQTGVRSVDLHGPELYSSLDVKKAIEGATGKKISMKVVEPSGLAEFFAKEVPEAYVQEFVDLIKALRPDGILSGGFENGENTVKGRTNLADGIRELASQ